jgi:hypothetical protein
VREAKLNRTLSDAAVALGVTYDQLMEAADQVAKSFKSAPYPGNKTTEEVKTAWYDLDSYEFWYAYSAETLFEFDNEGSACCPEYAFPDCCLFKV